MTRNRSSARSALANSGTRHCETEKPHPRRQATRLLVTRSKNSPPRKIAMPNEPAGKGMKAWRASAIQGVKMATPGAPVFVTCVTTGYALREGY